MHKGFTTLPRASPASSAPWFHVPVEGGASDPYLHAEKPPRCTLQFYFDSIDALETCCAKAAAPCAIESDRLKECDLMQQVMAVRRFPVPDPGTQPADDPRCTYW